MSGYEEHTFWCIKCGKQNFPLQRKVNHRHGKHHRKKLWCINCKQEINCVECRNDDEVAEFKEKFAAGEISEAEYKTLMPTPIQNKDFVPTASSTLDEQVNNPYQEDNFFK